MPTILLTNSYETDVLDFVRSLVPSEFNLISLSENRKEELIQKAPEADYFIVSGRLEIDREVIKAAQNLKMIQRTGVGVDQIDLQALKDLNIPLYVNKGVNAPAVAEHTLLLLLAVYRKLTIANEMLKKGIWKKQAFGIQTKSLYKKKIGLIGLGDIGLEFVKLLQPFNTQLTYHKRTKLDTSIEQLYGLKFVSKDEVLSESDVICLMCAYTEETHEILNAKAFQIMKRDAVVINTARGKLIEEKALIEALETNRISGAGLDVHYSEPLEVNHSFKNVKNVVMTAHIGGITKESFSEIYIKAFSNIQYINSGLYERIEHLKLK